MTGVFQFINDEIEKRLLDLNVAFVAKVLSTDGITAKIQPLGMIKQVGEDAKPKAPIPDVPILESARYKSVSGGGVLIIGGGGASGFPPTSTVVIINGGDASGVSASTADLSKVLIAAGDIVFCVCADRDITEARKGINSVPPVGHHAMSDCVIVGIL